jgi:hemolysin activation/secretion protein
MNRLTEQTVRVGEFNFRQLFWISSICLLSSTVLAQTVPSAGSILQQIERTQEPQPTARKKPSELIRPPAELVSQGGLSVTVQEFRFNGNHLISSEKLASVVDAFRGRPLDFNGLNTAASAVAKAYNDAGWIVRVFLPQQDITTGMVTMQVVEARFGGIRMEGEASQRIAPSELAAWFNFHQKEGQPLNANALDRALLLADDLAGVSVSGTLVQGQTEGETALALQSTDEARLYGDITLDNTGARSTGSKRLTANLNVNSPIGLGDALNLTAMHTQGSDYGRLGLTAPVGYDGLRLGVSTSSMRYKVIDGPNNIEKLGIRGNSSSLGLDLSYPIVRARQHNLYLSSALESKRFYSEDSNKSADPKSYADYASNSLRIGLSGNRFDDLGGGGANSASLQWQTSQLTNMVAHKQFDSIGRNYNKLNFSLSRQQTLSTDHSLLLSLQGQQASKALDSSEKFYIGGMGSVRAYPSSELSGERGQVVSGEWRWRLNPAWVISAFVDHGSVVSLPATAGESVAKLQLRGHGLSATWQGPMGINARVTWSQRDGHNPKATTAGTDSDGTLKKNRIWFNTSVAF